MHENLVTFIQFSAAVYVYAPRHQHLWCFHCTRICIVEHAIDSKSSGLVIARCQGSNCTVRSARDHQCFFLFVYYECVHRPRLLCA